MSRKQQLQDLCRIAELLADRALVPVVEAQSEAAKTQARLDALSAHRLQLSQQTDDPVLSALLARQSARLRAAQSGVNLTMATQQAAVETAKAVARPAVGRHHVLEALLKREILDEQKRARTTRT